MPLVYGALILMVMIATVVRLKKQNEASAAWEADRCRKTNAKLESELLTGYILKGMDPEEAFKKTKEDLCDKGFVPCIPRNCLRLSIDKCDIFVPSGEAAMEYDSHDVKEKRELHDRYRDKFGKSPNSFMTDEDVMYKMYNCPEVGSYVVHPSYGTCEVTRISNTGYYVMEVVSESEHFIKYSDKSVTRLNKK